MDFKIVVDSCGELTDQMKQNGHFISVPLTLTVDGTEFIDDENFNQRECLRRMDASAECPRSACPTPQKYMEIFLDGADRYYVITLSGHLSGSYNSARLGRELALEQKPDLKIHIFDSRSASIGETLAAAHVLECEEKGMNFDETVKDTERYIKGRRTFFCPGKSGCSQEKRPPGEFKSLCGVSVKNTSGARSNRGRRNLSAEPGTWDSKSADENGGFYCRTCQGQ